MDVEKEHVLSVVEGCRWRIRGVDGAAERLGLRPTTLETRMAKLGIKAPRQRRLEGLQPLVSENRNRPLDDIG